MPKPSILTPALQDQIAGYVNAGSPIPLACKAAGVSWNTAKEWMKRGKREEDGIYCEFFAAMERAKARWAAGAAMRITKAGQKDWKADAWLLERRVKEFRKPEHRVELTGAKGGPVELQAISREQAIRELAELFRVDPDAREKLLAEMGNDAPPEVLAMLESGDE